MKTCPVCGSVAFGDAALCFGCMFRYDDFDPDPMVEMGRETQVQNSHRVSVPLAIPLVEPSSAQGEAHGDTITYPIASIPSFAIKLTPDFQQSGAMTWNCAVELVPA